MIIRNPWTQWWQKPGWIERLETISSLCFQRSQRGPQHENLGGSSLLVITDSISASGEHKSDISLSPAWVITCFNLSFAAWIEEDKIQRKTMKHRVGNLPISITIWKLQKNLFSSNIFAKMGHLIGSPPAYHLASLILIYVKELYRYIAMRKFKYTYKQITQTRSMIQFTKSTSSEANARENTHIERTSVLRCRISEL